MSGPGDQKQPSGVKLLAFMVFAWANTLVANAPEPTNATTTLVRQTTAQIEARKLKKAAREVDLFFMILPFFPLLTLFSGTAGPEETKNQAGRRQSSARFESV